VIVELPFALVIFGALVLVSLLTADGRWSSLFSITKPTTTLALLLVTGLPSDGRFGVLVVGALLLSALGDTALLHEGRGFFLAGIFLFLLAHLGYTGAFLLGGGAGPLVSPALAGLGVVTLSSIWLMRKIWPGVPAALKFPVALYGITITVMVASAYVMLAGPWPDRITIAIVAGAVSFYLSDALLAWSLFRHSLPNQQTLNLTFYWVGQLGIALGARWVSEG
jgi:alkenylglycerophosphocholine/alkenylglycerophosphoethanolamine hydrolase